MTKYRILIVSRAFFPGNSPRSFRTTELVKQFLKLGHDITLLTPKEDEYHVPFEKEKGVLIKDLGKPRFKILDINKGNKCRHLLTRIINRLMQMFFEYPDIQLMYLVNKALKNETKYDLLISIAAPHAIHWGVAWAFQNRTDIAKKWIADCGDPYMGATLETFPRMFYFKYFEKWFCRKADFISVPFEGAVQGYYPEFHSKIQIIPQGFDFKFAKISSKSERLNDIPTFAFAGSLIPGGRDPRLLLEYLVKLNQPFKFFIFTRQKSLIIPFIKKGDHRIIVNDYIPREELLIFLSKMDFIININNNNETQLPSKLIDYYLAGRPILAVNSNIVSFEIIEQFFEGNYSEQLVLENVDQYRIENVCLEFLKLAYGTIKKR